MSESLYGRHSRSPIRPSLPGHPYVPPTNQCDGCLAGVPVDARGFHRMSPTEAAYSDFMTCQKEKYEEEEE